jgi:phytanoyl-CoA hydroxylase
VPGVRVDRITYQREGYFVARNLISEQTLERIACDISGVLVRRAQALGLRFEQGTDRAALTNQLSALFNSGPANYMAAAKLTQHLVGVHRLGVSPELATALNALGIEEPSISTRPVIHYMANCLRIEGGYHKTPPHQDWRSVQGSVDGVTVWMPLFDIAIDDYALEIIPRSHRLGLLPSADHAFGHRVGDSVVPDNSFVALPIRRCDALFFSGFLVHRTGTSGGDLVRIALSYRFNNAAESTFVRRNYPDRYVYRAEKDLIDVGFPKCEDLDAVFGPEK